MNTNPIKSSENPIWLPPIKPLSRKQFQQELRAEKARLKMQKKAWLRKKAEKKLAEKTERKKVHKKENAQKKFRAKLKNKAYTH